MLVVADQGPAGVGAQGRLAGAGKAEEDGGVALGAYVRRAMHRHHALDREQVIEDPEHRFLHLAGIGRAADQDHALGEVDRDHRLGAGAVAGRVGSEAGQVDDRELGLEAFKLVALRTDQQGADEEVVPGELVDHSDPHPVLGLGASEQVGDEQSLLLCDGGEEIRLERGEMVGRHRLVVVPPDGGLGLGVADDELVVGGAAGMLAGADDERAVPGEQPLAAAHGRLDQLRGSEVPVKLGSGADTKPLCRHAIGHDILP
jgi:hypothetical protein